MDLVDLPRKCAAWKKHAFTFRLWWWQGRWSSSRSCVCNSILDLLHSRHSREKKHNKKSRTSQSAHICQDHAFSFPRFFYVARHVKPMGILRGCLGPVGRERRVQYAPPSLLEALVWNLSNSRSMPSETPRKLHPGKLTWNLKIPPLKRKIIWTKPPLLCSMLIFQGATAFETPKSCVGGWFRCFFCFCFSLWVDVQVGKSRENISGEVPIRHRKTEITLYIWLD